LALFTKSSINIVNTVCSIASYYGVGLEVLRTDVTSSAKESYDTIYDKGMYVKCSERIKPESIYGASNPRQKVLDRMNCKEGLDIEEQQQQNQSHLASLDLIEKCAINGTWVLVSTLKFPTFWHKMSKRLEKLHESGQIVNTFRLFVDLQGFTSEEIPETFLFDHCIKFYLTEKNNEDMEGFNDIWANILNDEILNARQLDNILLLEGNSSINRFNLNLESNIYESTILEHLMPQSSKAKSAAKIEFVLGKGSDIPKQMLKGTENLSEIVKGEMSPDQSLFVGETTNENILDDLKKQFETPKHI